MPTNPVFATATLNELRRRINEALSKANLTRDDHSNLIVRAVGRHASKDIIITAHSSSDLAILKNKSNAWLPLLSTELTVRETLYPLIVHRVPTSFRADLPEGKLELQGDNPGRLTSLTKILWASPKKAFDAEGIPIKDHTSLILYLSNAHEANHLIENHTVFRGALLITERSRRTLTQCHNCLRFGHTAARCSALPKCGRCSGDHNTTKCFCPEDTPCTDYRSCTHVETRCALCEGDHRAMSKDCPIRIHAAERLDELHYSGGDLFPT
jgi:hypothetical protein